MIIYCLNCNKEINLSISAIKRGRKSCSYSCKQKIVWSNPEYRKHMSDIHKGKVSGSKGKTWKIKDKSKLFPVGGWNKGKKLPQFGGKNHYRWIIDRNQLKDDSKERGGQFHREWTKQVKNRDNWSCRIADVNCDGRLEAHHILGWTSHPELRYSINNGITLCHAHHPRKRAEEKRLSPYFMELVSVLK